MRAPSWGAVLVAFGVLATGLAFGRGTLMSDQNVAAGSGSSGGLSIGASITGGTSTRLLYEGAGPVLADDAAFKVNDATALKQLFVEAAANSAAQVRAHNTSTAQWASTGLYALNDVNSYAGLQVESSTTPGDWNGITWHDQPMVLLSAAHATEATVRTNTGGALHFIFGNPTDGSPNLDRDAFRMSRTAHFLLVETFMGNEGLQRWTHVDNNGYLDQVSGEATNFHKSSCTLNGASPAQCSVALPYGSSNTPTCVCSPVGTTASLAAKACAVSVSGSTVTVTSQNNDSHAVSVLCW